MQVEDGMMMEAVYSLAIRINFIVAVMDIRKTSVCLLSTCSHHCHGQHSCFLPAESG